MNWFKRAVFAALYGDILAKYDATEFSRSRTWRSTPLQDARLDLTKADRATLQAKSRDWERNSCIYTKIAGLWEQYIVGSGIQFASASSNPEWNRAADQAWEKWKPLADIQSRFGFDNLQGVICRSFFVDGEVFIILTREGPYPRIQLIEAHLCETPDQLKNDEGKSVVDGVKIDALGRPVGYYFKTAAGYTLQDAANVIHIFEPARPGQYRGIPYCTAALNVLHDLEDLRMYEMRASKDAAEISTIIKTESGELPPALATMAQKFRTQSTASGTSGSVSELRREYYQQAVGGRTIVLQRGDSADQHVPERPGANTREYWRLLAADVCACAETPLSLVFPDSMQGTVYRGSLDAFAAFCRAKTAVMASYFRRVRNYAIRTEAAFNPALAQLPTDWDKTSNGNVRSPNVDIGRNSSAMIAELAAGLRTWSGIAAELGLDGKQLLKEKADEVVYIKQLAQEREIKPEEIASANLPQPEAQQAPDQQMQ